MKILTKQLMLLLVLLVTNVITPASLQTASGLPDEWETQVARLLQKSGLKYKKAGAGVWVINRYGKSRGNFQVVLASGKGLMTASVVVAGKKNMRLTSEAAIKLLHLADDFDYVKVGLDDDDDLFVRSEMGIKSLDVEQLKASIERVASAADRIHLEIKPFLIR